MEATARANGRPFPPEELHDNTRRFPMSDSSLVNMLRMESIQNLRQQRSLLHPSMPAGSSHGSDLAALREYLLPLQTDSLLQGNRSRPLTLSDYMLANTVYPLSSRILTDHHLLSPNATHPSPFLFPRERAIQPFSFSPSILDVRHIISHQSRGEGTVFQEASSALCHPLICQQQIGTAFDHEQTLPPPFPFHGRQPSLPLDLQLLAAMQANSKNIRDKGGEQDASKVLGTSVSSSKPKLMPAEEGAMPINCKLPESSKPYRKHQSENWKERYAELVAFQKQHGHCLVPNVFKQNPPLAEWVKRQRYQYKLKKLGEHNSMSDDRVKMLEKLGFVWNSHDLLWEERLNDLKQYKERHGDCNVPSKYSPNPSLAIWVKRQRRQYKFMTEKKVSTMTRMRVKKLTEIGFSWAARRATQDKERLN